MITKNPVVRFEMPAQDSKRMAEFYTKVFGWQTQQFGPEMANFVLATTAESDAQNKPKNPGQINGGFFTKTEQNNSTKIMIQVDDIRKVMQNVVAAGGSVMDGRTPGQPDEMPGLGLFANVIDTEGNHVALMQPVK